MFEPVKNVWNQVVKGAKNMDFGTIGKGAAGLLLLAGSVFLAIEGANHANPSEYMTYQPNDDSDGNDVATSENGEDEQTYETEQA